MAYPIKTWLTHPGRNPAHNPRYTGRRFTVKVPDRSGELREVTMYGARNPSRWLPHQGAREMARRAARIARGVRQ